MRHRAQFFTHAIAAVLLLSLAPGICAQAAPQVNFDEGDWIGRDYVPSKIAAEFLKSRVARHSDSPAALGGTVYSARSLKRVDTEGWLPDPEGGMFSEDELEFVFESNTDGFLYVVFESRIGDPVLLLPSCRSQSTLVGVSAHVPVRIPVDVYRFLDPPGASSVVAILSRQRLVGMPSSEALADFCSEHFNNPFNRP